MMGGTSVDYVSSYLYLGVDIDNMLTFKKHFENTFKNVSHKLFILRKTRQMINIKAALDITKTMLCSVIDYGNIFLSSCINSNLRLDYGGFGWFCSAHANMFFFSSLLIP